MTDDTSNDDPDADGGTPLSERDVARAVESVLPDPTVVDVRAADHGKNAVFFVTVEGPDDRGHRPLVLKVGTRFGGDEFLREPALLSLVEDRTTIPVPTVLGTDDGDALDDPSFVAETIPGETAAFSPTDLAPVAFERVCYEAGRNLAELHDALAVEGFGPLVPGEDLALAREFDDWPTLFETWLGKQVEQLADTRFDDCVPTLEQFTGRATERLSGALEPEESFDPVVTHGDYRLGNLRLDAAAVDTDDSEATREWGGDVTNGVVDWETPVAATAGYELAVTEAILVDWPDLDEEKDERLRERLYEGYGATTELVRDEAFAERRRLYRVAGRVRLMRNLDEEMVGRSDAAVDARAAEHRAFLADAGVL